MSGGTERFRGDGAVTGWSQLFGPFEGRAWLNTAHQGPLPRRAADVAGEMVAHKRAPWRISDESFFSVPAKLRGALAQLLSARPEDIALGNATTYGLDLLSLGLDLADGDEVLLADGDFPATVIPWLPLRRRGVTIRFVDARQRAPTPDEIAAQMTGRTKVLCLSWVFSFTGDVLDAQAVGELCRERGVTFILNGSQAVGARVVDVSALGADALVSCGFKWLCGPYGTGFLWLRPELLERLDVDHEYWLPHASSDLSSDGGYAVEPRADASRLDLFCTANFFNFAPWLEAVDLLLELGMDEVAARSRALASRLASGVQDAGWTLTSPAGVPSTLVFVSGAADRVRSLLDELQRAHVDVALRGGALRFSPHVHNSDDDVDRALEVLAAVTPG